MPKPIDSLAKAATSVLSPAAVAVLTVAATAYYSAPTLAQAALWGFLSALFGAIIPVVFIRYGMKRGWWADRHVHERSRRRWPLVVCLASVTTGMTLVLAAGGPRDLAVLAAAIGVAVVVMWAITDRYEWKVSVHTVVATTGAYVATLLYGSVVALVAWPLVVLVGWSRVHLTHHTLAQVAVGALIGAACTTGFALLR